MEKNIEFFWWYQIYFVFLQPIINKVYNCINY